MIKQLLTSMFMFSAMAAPAVLLLVLQLSSSLVKAGQLNDWYLQQLFEPTEAWLQQESQGRVHIYSGLRDTDVSRAMDEQFNRIEYMMFTGTVMTDSSGVALVDPDTGQVLVENDGC